MNKKYYVAVIVALVMAFVSAKFLFGGSVRNVIPWGLLTLIWGFAATNKSESWKLGAAYGFSLSFFFLWFDKSGHTSLKQFLELVIITALASLFGAFCGALLSRFAYTINRSIKK